MKKVLFTLMCLVFMLPMVFSQSNVVDIEKLKTRFAELNGIKVTDIKSASILTFGNEYYGYFKYKKDGKSNTTAQQFALGGPGGFGIGGATITCTGVFCEECDIEGLPNPMEVSCKCVRKVNGEAYCAMTKSITVGSH